MNSDYKNYALENLKTWVQDAITTSGASTQEVFNTIKEAVREEYCIYKDNASKCYELLALLNGNDEFHLTCDKDDPSEECKKSWTSFGEENYYPEEAKVDDCMRPWGHSDMEALQYTEEELNAMCDKAASDEKDKCREYNLREAEYYNKRAKLDLNPGPQQKFIGWTELNESEFNILFPEKQNYKTNIKEEISRNDSSRLDYKEELIYESPDGGKTVYSRKPGQTERTLVKEENANKWVLPVGVDGLTGDCFVNLPDDLLELANLKEGDEVEWVEKKDGSYILRKVIKQIKMEEC